MARGWESKSVESQQEETANIRTARPAPSPRQQQILSLELTRKRLLGEIEASGNPRFRELKQKALAHIEQQLRDLGRDLQSRD
jgi:hypothetical protein